MVHGTPNVVTLTFQNTGSYAWFGKWLFGIITRQPTDNTNWGPGTHQVRLTSDEITPVGATKVFVFTVTPPNPGTFTFQYQTFDAQGGVAFGATSTALSVVVS